MEIPVRQVVRRRQAQRLIQLPRPPPDHRTAQQGRDHLGGRAGRRRACSPTRCCTERGRALRQRAQESRREGGRSRRDLHADGARGGDRDARVRAHRRDPFGHLRRLLGRGAGRPDQRRRGQGRASPPTAAGGADSRSRSSPTSTRRSSDAPRSCNASCCGAPAPRSRCEGARRLVARADRGAKLRCARRPSSTPSIRSTCSTPPARPASPRASCTRPAATCCTR